ncbi:MAG: hypothetical protein AB7L09_00635 [Nitrospira sp.]
MSQNTSKRRLQKRKEREQRNRKNKHLLAERRRVRDRTRQLQLFAPFPRFEVDAADASGDIALLVKNGIDAFERNYVSTLESDTLAVLHEQHESGWTDFINRVAGEITDMTREQIDRSFGQLAELDLGGQILNNSPENLRRRVLPTSSFTLKPCENHWAIRCRSLTEVRSDCGLVYGSPHQPVIRFDGTERRIVFSRHALLQLGERILPHWDRHYIGQLYVFGFFYECVHFGRTKLSNGQYALVVYNACLRAGTALRAFMRELMGFTSDKELANHYYIVGYCPVTFSGDLAVAKTFLTPGYWQTPERKTLGRITDVSSLQTIEQACDEGINIVSASTAESTRDALRWFHTHGVPQIKRIEKPVFRGMDGPHGWNMDDIVPNEDVV